jgi:conjugal transfer mating pair stabilization protein TraG
LDYHVITSYGNGDIIKGVFDALALCANSRTGTLYQPLMRLGLGMGALWALVSMIWGDSVKVFATWFVPVFAVNALLFAPSVTVWVKDPLLRQPLKVDHVPLGLALCASVVSQVGSAMTEKIEMVLSQPDDLKYAKTGCLFASRLVQKTKTMRIVNEELASNMREFATQCVMYDAMLGRKYTVDDLRHSDDLWALVSARPSPVRSCVWRTPRESGQPGNRPEIVSCQEAVKRFNSLWDHEMSQTATLFGKKLFGVNSALNVKAEFLHHVESTHAFLGNSAKGAADIIKQQMMIHAIIDGVEQKSSALGNIPNIAARKAYLQQQATYRTYGEMVGDVLPVMHAVLEALSYTTFLFILPLAMLPSGIRFFLLWLQSLIWLQMWALLYRWVPISQELTKVRQPQPLLNPSVGILATVTLAKGTFRFKTIRC